MFGKWRGRDKTKGDELPYVHFGKVGPDRPAPGPDPEPDSDDEELDETPADVLAMLGFDPKEFSAVLPGATQDGDVRPKGGQTGFVEGDHPRDEDGRFAGGADVSRLSPDEFREAFGVHVERSGLNAGGPEAERHVAAVRQAVAALPDAHRKALLGATYVSVVDTIRIGPAHTASGMWQPHNPGKTYQGGQITVAAKVEVAGETRAVSDVAGVVTHEFGHAMDRKLGQASSSKAFLKSIPPEGARGTPAEEHHGRYFHLNEREVWAECYAVAFDTSRGSYFHGMSHARASEVYAAPIAAMKKIIAAKGLA